ncbi:ORF-136 [Agrotis segetum nucleopolyhedrovirus A]|uniref:ORF-136 n=1 Tax=Agrotis segetum nuclear polyhedrosis virus TaxID=1962501 RepID=Q287D6_NPVAS|nr:ORF-136 [Agrotis segetum nucleopolyhedrovirus A]AAZ38302.1 ORF-136 [Agrotis segetum nucleopolyhedrovirus A]
MSAEFLADVQAQITKITANHTPDPKSRLGDVLQHMGRNGLLLQRKKDEDFSINETIELSDTVRDYLNVLQTEKLSTCRLCYHNDDNVRCDFHKKYIFTKNPKTHYDEYVAFLNSEMGIISFVELYYSYMSVQFWKMASLMMMRDLTGFSSIKELLTYYNYECDEDVDVVPYETMDCDE